MAGSGPSNRGTGHLFVSFEWILAKTDPDVLNGIEPPSMLVTDPPEHTRLRRLVSRAFTPRALDGLRTRIHDIADELLRGLEGSAECDLITEYTSQIPIAVIAEMLAIPHDETRHLHEIGESATRLIATTAASWHDFREAMKALREFDPYIAAHIERLRQDDAANSILADVIHDGDLTDVETRMLAALVSWARGLLPRRMSSARPSWPSSVTRINWPSCVRTRRDGPTRSKRFCAMTPPVKCRRGSPPRTLTSRDTRYRQAKRYFFSGRGQPRPRSLRTSQGLRRHPR